MADPTPGAPRSDGLAQVIQEMREAYEAIYAELGPKSPRGHEVKRWHDMLAALGRVGSTSPREFVRYEMVRIAEPEAGKPARFRIYGFLLSGVRVEVDTLYLRDIPASPVGSTPPTAQCRECGCRTGGGDYCYQHAPYTVWPLKDGSFRSDRNGLEHIWLIQPPSLESEAVSPVGSTGAREQRVSRGKPDRRQRDEPPCRCGHFRREHKEIWDPEALKSFWFCSGCDREHKKYPATHHQPEVSAAPPVVGPSASEEA
jgi:hypothetical protein